MEAVAGVLGVTMPVLWFLICLFLTVPCAFVWRFVVGKNKRHAYAALSGAALSYYSFGAWANVQIFCPILGTYAIMKLDRKRCGLVTIILSFVYLISCHLYYMSGDAWKNGGIDATGALMILTLKVASAAMNYEDGLLKDEDLRSSQRKNKLDQLPSFLAFLGYCLNCGTHLAGPVYEMRDYLDWTEDTGIWKVDQSRPPPEPYRPAILSFLKALFCMVMHIKLIPLVPLTWYSDPGYYAWPFWKKVGYIYLTGFATRWKYYFVWSVAESACVMSGLGFSGWNDQKQPKWDRAINVDIGKVELATSAAQLPVYWNISVSTWLRHYVYDRLVPKGKKPQFWQLLTTQVVSAVWHGLYAGYLLFFVNSALMISGSKTLYRWQRALPENAVLGRNFLVLLNGLYTAFVLNTTSIGFIVLGLYETLQAYKSVYFSATLAAIGLSIMGNVIQPRLSKGSSSSSSVRADSTSTGKIKKSE